MKLILIRHGITEGNRRHLYYGSTDLPLLSEGVEELKALRESGAYVPAGKFYTSGMIRTEQTLEALYGKVPHEILPDLREMDFGAFEMRSYEEMKEDPAYLAWITGDNEANVCPGGESGEIVTDRAEKALAPVIAAGEDAVCITHGGVIGGLLIRWFGGELNRFNCTPRPGTGFLVRIEDGRPVSWEAYPG